MVDQHKHVFYTGLFRGRGDFIDLMGRVAGTHVPAPQYYLSREQARDRVSGFFFALSESGGPKEHHVALHVLVRIGIRGAP